MYRDILHISNAFYPSYHFLYWNLSVGKWLWPRYMQLFSNQHAVVLLDMMLRARIAIMNMRAMVVIVTGNIVMKKGKR